MSAKPHLPAIATACALLLAWAPMPYGYYQLLRIAVTACALWMFFNLAQASSLKPKACLISIAVLFNPLIPIHLPREAWAVIDPITAALLLFVSIRG